MPPIAINGGAASASHVPVLKSAVLKPVATTDLVGDWSGKVKAKLFLFINKSASFHLHVTGQTASTLTGTLTVDGHDFTGTLNGHIDSFGRFNYSIKDSGTTINMKGKLSLDGQRMNGTLSASYAGLEIKGKLTAARVQRPA